MISIHLAGKGSSGKSTLLPIVVEQARAAFPSARLLVVDADPHMSGTRLLGVTPAHTIGQLRSAYERQIATGEALPLDETREEFVERQLGAQALARAGGFDLLAMGHWEPIGSQCTVNRVLARALDAVLGAYDVLIVDNEAGIEHVGRYADLAVGLLLVVAQPEGEFLEVARQIVTRCREVGRSVAAARLVLNRVRPGDLDDSDLQAQLAALGRTGLVQAGALPESDHLRALSRRRRPIAELPADDAWRAAASAMIAGELQHAWPADARHPGARAPQRDCAA